MEEVEFICRACGWKGSSPAVKSWSEPSSTHRGPHGEDVHVPAHSGSMNICPECNKVVRTQKEWESDDFLDEMDSKNRSRYHEYFGDYIRVISNFKYLGYKPILIS